MYMNGYIKDCYPRYFVVPSRPSQLEVSNNHNLSVIHFRKLEQLPIVTGFITEYGMG